MSEEQQVYPFRRASEQESRDNGNGKNSKNGKSRWVKRRDGRHDGVINGRINAGIGGNIGDAEAMAKEREFWGRASIWPEVGAVDLFCLAAGVLLGRACILGGLYPFGIAYAAAAVVGYWHFAAYLILAVLLGTALALGRGALVYGAAIMLTVVLLYIKPRDEKRDWLLTPLIPLAVLIVVRAVALLAVDQVSAYNMMVVCFEGLFAAGLALVLLIAVRILHELADVRSLSADELVCIFVLFLGCICGLGDLHIGSVELRDVISRFLVMLAACWSGAGAGAGVGALMGILPSLEQAVSPSLIGMYAFAGLLAGSFRGFARLGTAVGFMLGNVMLSFYILNAVQIQQQLLATAVAAVLFLLVPEKLIKKGGKIFTGVNLRTAEEEKNRRRLRFSARRLQSAAWIFRELAAGCRGENSTGNNVCNNMSNNAVKNLAENQDNNQGNNQDDSRTDEQDKSIAMVLNHLSNQVCSRCTIRNLCWSVDFEDTYRGVMCLFNIAEQKGSAAVQDVPENFSRRCPHLRELVATVNCLYELYCQSNYWQMQRTGSRIFLAGQLEGTAEVMERLAAEMTEYGGDLNYIERALTRRLARQGLGSGGVQVTHMGEKNLDFWVSMEECPGEVFCRDMAAREVSRVLQQRFRTQEIVCGGNCGGGCCFHMLKEGAGRLDIGKAQLAKDGGRVCGDSGDCVALSEGRQLLMISDGMGVGVGAAMKSGSAVNMLTRLLEVGFDRYTAVDTVNTVLMLQGGEEAFVTLDMCIIDRYDNTAEFIKTGAGPSFIRRGGQVEVIKNASLPVGMLQTVDKAVYRERLQPGDMVIMASDGLLDADSKTDLEWLVALLEDSAITDAQAMAEYLLGRAVAISGGRLRDDITILVASVF